MTDERKWRNLTADDIPALEDAIRETVDWFDDESSMPTDDFIDRFCKSHGGDGYGSDDWDIDNYDSDAARAIMKIARAERKDRKS